MAEPSESKRYISIDRLQSLHSSPPPSGLNVPFRNELQAFVASNKCHFAQDNVGNIYITHPGTDKSLSAIALTYPLDTSSSSPAHNAFTGAIHTFSELLQTRTKCEICLLGWSTPGNSSVGQDVWEDSYSLESAYEKYPELKNFDGCDDVSAFTCSALLEIIMDVKEKEKEKGSGGGVEVRGSALLGEKARGYLPANGTVSCGGGEGPRSSRCPVVRIRGEGAVGVGKGVVVEYSEYVAKLFENFD
ncbi:MAG: hypothetical protein Q9161_008862 [Pseudevernia consocians]